MRRVPEGKATPAMAPPPRGGFAMSSSDLTIFDVLALGYFLACWIGFGRYSSRRARSGAGLVAALRVFRHQWMERLCQRDNRQSDATVLGNLVRGALFFASTTVFILGGLFALLGTTQKVIDVVAALPFTGPFSLWLWEAKALLLIYIFVYSFFKFTWSAWQYNALSIVIGAAPDPKAAPSVRTAYIASAADIAALAGESFNHGIRAYYFSMAAVTWFLHPLALVIAATWVAYVLYRREFASPTLRALRGHDDLVGASANRR
jgi:uncharacterized membrane protein